MIYLFELLRRFTFLLPSMQQAEECRDEEKSRDRCEEEPSNNSAPERSTRGCRRQRSARLIRRGTGSATESRAEMGAAGLYS